MFILFVLYFLIAGLANLSIMGNSRDTGGMLLGLFLIGFIAIPAMFIIRVLR